VRRDEVCEVKVKVDRSVSLTWRIKGVAAGTPNVVKAIVNGDPARNLTLGYWSSESRSKVVAVVLPCSTPVVLTIKQCNLEVLRLIDCEIKRL